MKIYNINLRGVKTLIPKIPTFFLLPLLLMILLSLTQQSCESNKAKVSTNNTNSQELKPIVNKPFPDFGFMIDTALARQQGIKVFQLSQNYPTQLPNSGKPKFLEIDFQKNWREYLDEVQKYCFEGNTEVDFRVEENKTRSWYHMPWQHYSKNGREGYHGLTKEAPVKAQQLATTQSYSTGGAWAIGFFNDVAGYTIGQVWKDHDKPDVGAMSGGFKNGAVLFKLLFVSIPQEIAEKQVPFLQNGKWWDAYATYTFETDERTPISVALIQMDIMVRDDRAPFGWVFGNFQYNGQLNKANKWENLVPVGVMWGQDPDNNTDFSNPTPKETIINKELKQTIINPNSKELPATHLGWNGRLNGPVDNPRSSCYSCHSTAEYPQGSPISPLFFSSPDSVKANPPGSPGWMRWFQNLPCGTSFDGPKYQSTDFCLQMAEAIQNFNDWKNKDGGLYHQNYTNTKNGAVAVPELRKVYPLGRRNM